MTKQRLWLIADRFLNALNSPEARSQEGWQAGITLNSPEARSREGWQAVILLNFE